MLSFQSYVCLSDNISNRSIIFYEWNDSKMFKCVWHSSFHLDHIIHSSCHCINLEKVYTEINCVFLFQDAFSLVAYSDPWSSPMGYQLDPVQREKVCASLNSSILGKNDIVFVMPPLYE